MAFLMPGVGEKYLYRVQRFVWNAVSQNLYRIEDPEELEYLALRDLFDRQSVLLVEWPQHGDGNLPPPDVVLDFGETNEERFVSCSVISAHGRELAGKIELPT